MKLAFTVAIFLIFAAWMLESWKRSNAQRRRDRERDRHLDHITGARRWWNEPPNDGPEGDH